MSLDLRDRVILAIKQQSDRKLLIDPIEADPLVAHKIRDAAEEARRTAVLAGWVGRARSHVIWNLQAKILAEHYGIVWFSPRDTNPDVTFD